MIVRATRRRFLHSIAGFLSLVAARLSFAQTKGAGRDVHRATRNTRLGALGEKLPRLERAPDDAKAYAGFERIALPELKPPAGAELATSVRGWQPGAVFSGESISLETLARVLHHTNGVTKTQRGEGVTRQLRAAPSAGALYSGELYVAARRVDGLSPGLYAYMVKEHTLVELRKGSVIGEIAASLAEPVDVVGAAAIVLLSNVFARYTWRYANRGYRYALIDTGHIGENLRLSSAAAGLASVGLPDYEDNRLAALLGIDGVREAVCAVHALGVAGDRSLPDSSDTERQLVERQTLAPAERGTLYQRYHAATALMRGQSELAPPPMDPANWPAGRGSVALPSGPDPKAYVEGVIRIRRSASQFLPEPLEASDLAFVLEMANAHTPLDRQMGVSLFVVANRVEGLAPGLYRYDREARALVVQRRLDLAEDLHRVCLRQDHAREAAVAIAFVAELGPVSVHTRHRTYRDLLIEAGSIAQRVYLAAEAIGGAARNLAAFTDDDLNRLLRIDGRTRAAIHLTMLGPGD